MHEGKPRRLCQTNERKKYINETCRKCLIAGRSRREERKPNKRLSSKVLVVKRPRHERKNPQGIK